MTIVGRPNAKPSKNLLRVCCAHAEPLSGVRGDVVSPAAGGILLPLLFPPYFPPKDASSMSMTAGVLERMAVILPKVMGRIAVMKYSQPLTWPS